MRGRLSWLLLASCIGLGAAAGPADPEGAPLREFEAMVSQWVALRRQLAREKRDWEENRGRWEREIALLQEEKLALEAEIEKTGTAASSAAELLDDLVERRDRRQGELRELGPILDRAEADLREWRKWIPAALDAGLRAALDRIPASGEEAESVPVTHRLRLVMAARTGIESLQHAVQVTREMLPDGSGNKRELDVLYLGLARAFAVSADDHWAAVGVPGPDGWSWTPRPALAADVRAAIRMHGRTTPAGFVSLPLRAGPGSGRDNGK